MNILDDYSSIAGYDLQNNGVFISAVLTDEICEMFYAKKTNFEFFDYGGGVFDISVSNILKVLDTPEKIRKFLGNTVITKKQSVEIFDVLLAAHNSRPYSV